MLGKYKDSQGKILTVAYEIVGPLGVYNTLGGVWMAYADPVIAGRGYFLVTPETLDKAGYVLVPDET